MQNTHQIVPQQTCAKQITCPTLSQNEGCGLVGEGGHEGKKEPEKRPSGGCNFSLLYKQKTKDPAR